MVLVEIERTSETLVAVPISRPQMRMVFSFNGSNSFTRNVFAMRHQ